MNFVEMKIILKDEAKKENKEYFMRVAVNYFFSRDYSSLNIIDNQLFITERDLDTKQECVKSTNINDIDLETTALLYPDANIWAMKETTDLKGKAVYLKDDLDKNFDGYRKWTTNMAKGKAVTVKNVFDDGKSFNIEDGNPRTCYSIDMIDESKKLYSAAQIRYTLISIYLHLEREQREIPNYREWDDNKTKVTPPPSTNYPLPLVSVLISLTAFILTLILVNYK